jgi:hypothetical protein
MIFNLPGAARNEFAVKIAGRVEKELFISSAWPMKVEKKRNEKSYPKKEHIDLKRTFRRI